MISTYFYTLNQYLNKILFFKKLQIKFLIHAIKGRKILKEENKSDLVETIKIDFAHTNLFDRNIEIYDLNKYKINFNDICTQKLLLLLCGEYFSKKIFEAVGNNYSGFIHPLPNKWISILQGYGFSFNKKQLIVCKSFYFFLCIFFYLEGLSLFCYKIFKYLISFYKVNRIRLKSNAVFVELMDEEQIPNKLQNQSIFSWYQKKSSDRNIEFYHNINLKIPKDSAKLNLNKLPNDYFDIQRFNHLLKFIIWFFIFHFFLIFNFRKFFFFELFILSDLITAKITTFKKGNNVPYECLFYKSYTRPLWTHILEEKGSKIALFFYSINYRRLSRYKDKIKYLMFTSKYLMFTWHLSYWPNMYVWSSLEIEFLKIILNNQ